MMHESTNSLIEWIRDSNDNPLALIISHRFHEPGATFFTPPEYSQQLAYMRHPTGHKISSHYHKLVERRTTRTCEVLAIRWGQLRVDIYDSNQQLVAVRFLSADDVILLIAGGHGFEVISDVEMVEIKTGPFAGVDDKVRFEPK